jgi:hypothetical protein
MDSARAGGLRTRSLHAALATLGLLGMAPICVAQPAPSVSASAPLSPSDASPAASCELHIWPADTTHTSYSGWMHGGAVDGARRGIKGYPDLHAEALDTAQQARLLATIDWRGAAGDPTLTVVVHPAPTGSDNDRARTVRLVGGSGTCYREVIITSSIVEAAAFSTRSVRVLALRKRFDGAGGAPVNFSSMSEAVIQFSDADKAAKDADARMDAAAQSAFVKAVGKFAVMQSFH